MIAWKISPICFIIILSFKVKLFTSSPDPEYYEGSGSEPDTNEVAPLSGKTFPRNRTIRNRELYCFYYIWYGKTPIFILGELKYLLVRLDDNSMNYPETPLAPTGKKH